MSRILFLAKLNPNKFGSMEEHAVFLCKEAARRGHQIFAGFVAEPIPEVRKLLEGAGAHVIKLACGDNSLLGNPAQLKIREIFSLYRTIKENRIDLIHVSFAGLTDPSIMGIYLTGAKIVFTDQASGVPFCRHPLKQVALRLIHFLIARRVAKYIGITDYVSKRLFETHHVAGDKVVTIFNSINIERFRPRDTLAARNDLGFPPDRRILCSVAMLIPEKGVQHLLQAVAQLVVKNGMHDLLLVIAGEGYYRDELERLIDKLGIGGHVLFLGRRSDVHLIIAAADVVVVPSVWEEAFGIIIAEAMASARPVVASNIGGIPELVDDGVTGKLVEPGDSDGLARAIHKLLMDITERERLGNAGLVQAREKFDLARQVVRIVDLYETV